MGEEGRIGPHRRPGRRHRTPPIGDDDARGEDSEGTDEFIARQAWLYVSIVAGAYFVSRGLAKSGSREPYWSDGTNADRGDSRR